MKDPEFIAFVGAMFSCKSSRLIETLDRFQRQGRTVAAFKPAMDDRYASNEIVTHNDKRWSAVPVSSGNALLAHLAQLDDPPSVIGVDEAFMIPGCAEALLWLFKQGITCVVASLDMSATGQPFDEIKEILPFATRIDKLSAVCAVSGRDARYTYRKSGDGPEIMVGGGEDYEPRCFQHFPPMNRRDG